LDGFPFPFCFGFVLFWLLLCLGEEQGALAAAARCFAFLTRWLPLQLRAALAVRERSSFTSLSE
jgi:hypothetical protein